jgi:alkylation response protein AidB-like acyl-CoA dehydrogenase
MHWLPLSRAGKILGTYCQTELGHGSFVRGVETTATYDINTDEFIVHSPTPSSKKFWPGGLGFSATHAVVMARLIVGDKDHGPNLFIVQLRSIPDGKPLPGLKLGDVGLKMAYVPQAALRRPSNPQSDTTAPTTASPPSITSASPAQTCSWATRPSCVMAPTPPRQAI